MRLKFLLGFALIASSFSSFSNQFDSAQFFTQKAQEFRFKNLDSIQFYAEKAKLYGIRARDERGAIAYHSIIGVSLMERGLYDSALIHQNRAKTLSLQFPDSIHYARVIHHIGVVYKEKSQPDLAIDCFLSALKLAQKNAILDLEAIANMNLATVYGRIGDYKAQLRHAKASYDLSKDNPQLATAKNGALVELGVHYFNTGKLDSSILFFDESLKLMEATGIRDGYSVVINNLGILYYYTGKYQDAISSFEKARIIAVEAKDQLNTALATMNIGDTYSTIGDMENAEKYLSESLTSFKKLRHLHFLRDNYECLANMSKRKGDLNKTLAYTDLKYAYKDSILNESTTNKIANLQVQYETEKKEQEIATLKAEAEVKELQIVQTRILLAAIVLLALLIVITIVFLNRQKALKLKEQTQRDRFRTIIEAEESERKRVARELHDGLGQMLSTVRLFVSDLDDRTQNTKVDRSLKALDSTIAEVRSISHNMMPIKLMELGLAAALQDMADRVNESDKLRMELSEIPALDLPETESIALYRSIQEVVNNAIKYAHAHKISISISQMDDQLQVSIVDDGQGFNTENIAKSKGIGWSNIFARMDLVGGHVDVVSKTGEGTRVTLSVPLSKMRRTA